MQGCAKKKDRRYSTHHIHVNGGWTNKNGFVRDPRRQAGDGKMGCRCRDSTVHRSGSTEAATGPAAQTSPGLSERIPQQSTRVFPPSRCLRRRRTGNLSKGAVGSHGNPLAKALRDERTCVADPSRRGTCALCLGFAHMPVLGAGHEASREATQRSSSPRW